MATNPPIPQIDPQQAAIIAAQQQPWLGAPQTLPQAPLDLSAPTANVVQGPQGMPNSNARPPMPTPGGMLAQAPPHVEMAAPSTQGSAPTKPGPLKNFLTSFLYGAGQSLREHVGLPTDQQIAVQNAGIENTQANTDANIALKNAQTDTARQNAALLIPQPTDPNDQTLPPDFRKPGVMLNASQAQAIRLAYAHNQNALGVQDLKNQGNIAGKQVQYGADSYLRHTVTHHDGGIFLTDKGTGQDLQRIGTDTAMITGPRNALARAQAGAAYRTFDTTDDQGNPVTISGLDALRGGAAHIPYTQAKGVLSDLVGVRQYDSILGRIQTNLSALDDPAQRVAIAHTFAESEKNPGAFQALIISALQSHALSPQGAQLAADIKQGQEFGGVARKYGGNMNGTEGLMNRIMANQASPLNSTQLNNDLIQNDRNFTARAQQTITGMMSHNAGRAGGPPNVGGGQNQSVPQSFSQTATGPNGHKIGFNGRQWVDAQTGVPVQ